jgi:hypothetical protein
MVKEKYKRFAFKLNQVVYKNRRSRKVAGSCFQKLTKTTKVGGDL